LCHACWIGRKIHAPEQHPLKESDVVCRRLSGKGWVAQRRSEVSWECRGSSSDCGPYRSQYCASHLRRADQLAQ
jgi:hypothetical protein